MSKAAAPAKNYLAAIHRVHKELGISADDAVSLKQKVTGVQSARDMTDQQRRRYLAHLGRLQAIDAKARGETPAYTPRREALYRSISDDMDERWGKARALWQALADAGAVHHNTDAALLAFVKSRTKVEHWRFLSTWQVNQVIENLKKWCERAGVPTEPKSN